jgi:predicted phosphodiesterase
MSSAIRIAVLTDIHYTGPSTPVSPCKGRASQFGDVLFERAIGRLNAKIKPDVALILGDLVDNGCVADLRIIKQRIQTIDAPTLLIPGNHDGDIETFDQIFGSLPQSLDVRGFRIIALRDPEQPGYNAVRTEEGFAQMRAARRGHSGPIIAAQHVPLFPPGTLDLYYNYVNAPDVIACMQRANIGWAIAGHAHRSAEHIDERGTRFIAAPALCEQPFQFMEIVIEGNSTRSIIHSLSDEPAYSQWRS